MSTAVVCQNVRGRPLAKRAVRACPERSRGKPAYRLRELGRIDGWWNDGFHRKLINREFPVCLVLNLSGEPAVLTHRLGEVSLDNAFALIEAHLPETSERA